MATRITRAGQFVKQPTGYQAFVPTPLPPDPPIAFESSLITLLSAADQSVGRLDGVSKTLLNPELFVAMYIRREAVLSSQIEGTQSSLDDVLTYELDPGVMKRRKLRAGSLIYGKGIAYAFKKTI